MKWIPDDFCRCHNASCPEKESCLRWIMKDSGDEFTPHSMDACGGSADYPYKISDGSEVVYES